MSADASWVSAVMKYTLYSAAVAIGEDGLVKDVLEDGDHIVDEDYCGSCYGAAGPDECCNTCEDVKNAYRKKGWSFEGQGRGIAVNASARPVEPYLRRFATQTPRS
eukprot:SAG31_NODE_13643_length_855_cov_4.900419_2_plen_106_part_00